MGIRRAQTLDVINDDDMEGVKSSKPLFLGKGAGSARLKHAEER